MTRRGGTRSARFALVAAVAIAAMAWLVPSAFAGVGSSVTVVPTPGSTGSAVVTGFNLNCFITNGIASGVCTSSGLSSNPYRVTVQNAAGTTLTSMPGCPTIPVITNQTVGGFCQFNTDGINDTTIFVTLNAARTITVSRTGSGTGTVTSSPAGINCGAVCSAAFPNNSFVTLTAFPSGSSVFANWTGACAGAGTSPTCTVAVISSLSVGAVFNNRPTFNFTVTTAGAGSGTVTSSPAGLTCPPTCAAAVVSGTTLTLTATPAGGSEFGGWSGSCSGTGTCTITVTAAGAATATFSRASVDASVEGTFFTRNGPRIARRVLNVNLAADEQVRVNMRIVRNGVILASRTLVAFSGDRNVRFPVRNGIGSGRAQLQTTFTDQFGNTKSQNRRIRIPGL